MKKSIWIRIKCFLGFHNWSKYPLEDDLRKYGFIVYVCRDCEKKSKIKSNLEDWG